MADEGRVWTDYFPGNESADTSAAALKEFSIEKMRAFVLGWFYFMYEDPANRTPHESAEGGYQYIWGGPFDARDVITEEFEGIVPDDVIGEVVKQVEGNGGAWAPTPDNPEHFAYEQRPQTPTDIDLEFDVNTNTLEASGFALDRNLEPSEKELSFTDLHPPFGQPNRPPFSERDPLADHDQIDARLKRGVKTSFGSTYDRAVRQTVLTTTADLKALLAKPSSRPAIHGGVGHNQPPSDIELDQEKKEELKAAVETINEELTHGQPDVRKVSRAARRLQLIGQWVARKLDMTVEAFLKTVAVGLASLLFPTLDIIIQKTLKLYQSIIDWLNAVVLPF